MLKAVIYARYSSQAQTEQSIEGQVNICTDFCTAHDYQIVNSYIERAKTGTDDNRPAFQQLIADAETKAFDVVVVYKFDRFARNRYHSVFYKHKLSEHNIRVVSAMEPISDDPGGLAVEAIYEVWAEWFSKDLSQKVKRGMGLTADKGKFTGGHIAYGYSYDPISSTITVNEQEAEVLRIIFSEYASGTKKTDIINMLNSKGFRKQDGKMFNNRFFETIIENRRYIGETRYAGIERPNIFPPIIDKEIFEAVQKIRPGHKHLTRTNYLLTGKLFCGHCGSPMKGTSSYNKAGRKYAYYICPNKDKKREAKQKLEDDVINVTLEHILEPGKLPQIAEMIVKEFEKNINEINLQSYKDRYKKVETEIQKCFQLMVDSDSDSIISLSKQRIKELEIQKADFDVEISKLQVLCGVQHTKADIIKWLKIFIQKKDISKEEYRSRLIKLFVYAVYVYDDKLLIYYNSTPGTPVRCSTTNGLGVPEVLLHEHKNKAEPLYVFVENRLGIIILRK